MCLLSLLCLLQWLLQCLWLSIGYFNSPRLGPSDQGWFPTSYIARRSNDEPTKLGADPFSQPTLIRRTYSLLDGSYPEIEIDSGKGTQYTSYINTHMNKGRLPRSFRKPLNFPAPVTATLKLLNQFHLSICAASLCYQTFSAEHIIPGTLPSNFEVSIDKILAFL